MDRMDGVLRDASQMVTPAVAELAESLSCPPSDRALLALALRLAATIDAMPDAMAGTMLPNHAGPMIKILAELEDRARKRREKDHPGRVNKVAQIRGARAAADKRRRAG
jgi:hypothetical protein